MNSVKRIVEVETAPERVRYETQGGAAVFDDDVAHFETGVLRLLGMDKCAFEDWLEVAFADKGGEELARLGSALLSVRPPPPVATPMEAPVEEGPEGQRGELWHAWVAKGPAHGVARTPDGLFAWLVRPLRDRWAREVNPPTYDEAYFEGGRITSGYGSYMADDTWRVEKARRQVREIRDWACEPISRALDIGSGYGYFRAALSESGIEHEGLDVSDHAAEITRRRYGFQTYVGLLEDYCERWAERYDLITLWDVLEHVPDAVDFLDQVAACLRPGGKLVLKTPNLTCPEAQYLGPHYHSLQRPHLLYFTPQSLEILAGQAGLHQRRVDTTSHLLRGFVGQRQVDLWAEEGRGADFTAYLVKE